MEGTVTAASPSTNPSSAGSGKTGGAWTVVLIRTPLWMPGLINLIFHPSANGKFTKDLQ